MKSEWQAGLNDLEHVARDILQQAGTHRLFAFYGEMGAGKTTFITHFAKALGSTDRVHSPTFGLVNEYLSGNGESIYHFDFYRIENMIEAYDMGYETYFYSGDYCFIEWPEKVQSLLPDDAVKVRIEISSTEAIDNTKNRKITAEYSG
jgi:tRNA threonylcarbamoyladenosine biosynthesis protein TsaE